jgi:hypothetical protein
MTGFEYIKEVLTHQKQEKEKLISGLERAIVQDDLIMPVIREHREQPFWDPEERVQPVPWSEQWRGISDEILANYTNSCLPPYMIRWLAEAHVILDEICRNNPNQTSQFMQKILENVCNIWGDGRNPILL